MKRFLLILSLLSLPAFIWFFWQYSQKPETISSTLQSFDKAGEETKKDLSRIPSLPVTEEKDSFTMQDDTQTGISITYANQQANNQLSPEESNKDLLSLSFPKDATKPLEIKLDTERIITIQDLKNQQGFTQKLLTQDAIQENPTNAAWYQKLFKTLDPRVKPEDNNHIYLTSTNQRKTLIHTFQKDYATNEKKLKSWTLYTKGNGIEEEAYQFTNAKIKINDDGNAEVFYFGDKEIQNQQAQANVEPSLLERAQRVISQDMGEDILNSNKNPDFLIPKPFFYDKNGDIHETDWKYDETNNTLSLQISVKDDLYPLALDPTLAFTAPAQSNTGWVIDGEEGNFGLSMASGDFNADGKTDLVVGAAGYSSNSGRVYVFYSANGGSIVSVTGANVIISGQGSSDYFGGNLASGDWNADGRIDFVVGARGYSGGGFWGRAYIFYNDGSISTTAATADIIITGEGATDFTRSFAADDFNADGKTDLAIGANSYSSYTGRAYIFYSGSIITESASGADVIITGEGGSEFGYSLTSGDFNADGKVDLAAGATAYSSYTGRAYIFYNDGSIPTTAATADVFINGQTGSDYFGRNLTSGDFNTDGKTDLAATADKWGGDYGRLYLFYNDGSIPTTAATADVIFSGISAGDYFGYAIPGDFNADGRTDLAVRSAGYSGGSNIGRVYVFYNDGAYPASINNADVIITGETTSNSFGNSLASGDFNTDGKTDLVVGASNYASSRGRVYIFTSQNGQVNTNVNLTGETTSNNFGASLTSGDFNADGKTDLAVGASAYSTNTGRTYLFYNDGSIPTTAATADVIITGETTNNYFGIFLASGDFNADSKTDLVVGARGYSTDTGRAYFFYNDGSIPTTAATADVIITGEAASYFGWSLASGDWNTDGKTDLAVGAKGYSTSTGRAYIFYNDGSIPTTAVTADVIITGETTSTYLGSTLASGDFNADGKTDLAVGAYVYSTNTGRTYLFYNDGSIPTTAATADVIITGETTDNYFGYSLASGDFNADGKTDLAVGAITYSTSTGRTYLFYNDGSIPTTATTADLIITGETTNTFFGNSLASGDFNADGKTDLAVGANLYSTNTGRVYIFYNDGSIPTTAAAADVMIVGETTSNYFGWSLASGDWNTDGRMDLAVGAYGYSTSTGRVYLYETRDNFAWQLQAQSSLSGGLRVNPGFSGQELKVTGEVGTGQFGNAMIAGDFNADGKTDLAVGASAYSTNTGRVYIFYNDGHLAAAATSADIVISGEASSIFGTSLASGDFNADGKIDLAVNSSSKAYVFYNDGAIPTTATTADVIITTEGGNNFRRVVAGDFNADGKTDLAFSGDSYSTFTGRVYIFYNDGSYPSGAATADVIITGTTTNDYFGYRLAVGDLNADGRVDLVVADSAGAGKTYIFYNDGSIPTTAATADVTITGFGGSVHSPATGDFNADGKTDLAIGNSSGNGNVYLFYNDGSIPTTTGTADVTITGEGSSQFGHSLVAGDFNADGWTDLAIGANNYTPTSTGRAYIFYNDGSIPTTAATADVIITGETTNNSFGASLASGDFNADGKTDFVVGADGYSSNRGRVYMYTFNDGVITGETTSNYFGYAMTAGDFNADGKTDLAVGSYGYSTNTGRVYLFYNDGSVPTTAATADMIITGEATGDYFGKFLSVGDVNADGKTDVLVGAGIATKAYIFYNDGSYPALAANSDVIISGSGVSSVSSGDLNTDGKADILITNFSYGSDGRAYLFYADGTNNFGTAACTGSNPTTCTASNADIIVNGTGGKRLGTAVVGDVNADGRADMLLGGTNSTAGELYVLYNDGTSFGTAACTTACSVTNADVTISGENAGDNFAGSIAVGDMNTDGKADIVAVAQSYSSNTGRVYFFYNDGSYSSAAGSADVIITGEGTTTYALGDALVLADMNTDGRTDMVIGNRSYSNGAGCVYIVYNDGLYPATLGGADIRISGEGNSQYFGFASTFGDFNADGKMDLAVGANGYSTNTGRAYIFITEAKVEDNVQQLKSKGAFKAKGDFRVK